MSIDCLKCEGTGISAMRRSIIAPPGHVIVVRDLSQIEARMLAWLSEQEDLVEEFRYYDSPEGIKTGQDVYCSMASTIFSHPVYKKTDKVKRFIGKTTVLGCGYGLGWRTYQQRLRIGMLGDKGRILDDEVGEALNVNLEFFQGKPYIQNFLTESLPPGLDFETHALHCACCEAIINLFRSNKPKIPEFWDTCTEMIVRMYNGESCDFGRNGLLRITPAGLVLPNATLIRYPEMEAKRNGRRTEYTYLKNRKKHERVKMYGGSVTENIVQALSRIVITDNMLKMHAENDPAVRPRHQVHDEILTVCREDEASDVYRRMGEIMGTPPEWCPELPLASEGGWSSRYVK
jgi:DNA polymerase bacteriophage-type